MQNNLNSPVLPSDAPCAPLVADSVPDYADVLYQHAWEAFPLTNSQASQPVAPVRFGEQPAPEVDYFPDLHPCECTEEWNVQQMQLKRKEIQREAQSLKNIGVSNAAGGRLQQADAEAWQSAVMLAGSLVAAFLFGMACMAWWLTTLHSQAPPMSY